MRCLFHVMIGLIMLAPSAAHACRCMPMDDENAAEAYNSADTVVLARPVLFSQGWHAVGPLVSLDIEHVYKGETVRTGEGIVAQYNPLTPACGNAFEKNTPVIVGLYDLDDGRDEPGRRGGYRVMDACSQAAIARHVTTIIDKQVKE